jgi:hypothetical protein
VDRVGGGCGRYEGRGQGVWVYEIVGSIVGEGIFLRKDC